ncbi:hypothetical protein IH992_03815 [Candidatus Poribacteria bacterium]|nr:hypothetical protein [Candidatus Poribacteria bacterium]
MNNLIPKTKIPASAPTAGVTTTTTKPTAMLEQMGASVYRQAFQKGMSMSAYLEYQDPSQDYNDGLDAYSRLLKVAGIRTQSHPEMGIWASEYDAFMKNEHTRALVPEFFARVWRGVQTQKSPSTRGLLLSSDGIPGSWERPYAEAEGARWDKQVAPAIPLSQLIAITTPVDSNTYRSFYLTDDATQTRMVRVAEGDDIPEMKLTSAEHTIDLYKYGRSIRATDEQLRRTRIDKIAFFIRRMAIQSEIDKVAAVLDIIVNGDGNSNTAATSHNLTTLDTAASAGTLTVKGWLAFKMKFANPYQIMTALAQEAEILQLLLLNVGSANVPLVTVAGPSGFGQLEQINPGLRDNVMIGWTTDAPANKIVGTDTRMGVERLTEIGSNISETERFISNQTEVLVMTEVEGYAILDGNTSHILVVNA